MQIPQFTELQAKQLSTFLNTQSKAMNLEQSQGYLFGVICSPTPLDVHEWLEQILPNTANDLDEEMLFLFMALYHKISEQVFETGYKLPVEFTLEFCKPWSEGFLVATKAYAEPLLNAPELDAEFKEALGRVRGKFSGNLKTPDSELTMEYSDLLSESKDEIAKLVEELMARLERLRNDKMLERKALEAENLNKSLGYRPMNPGSIFVI